MFKVETETPADIAIATEHEIIRSQSVTEQSVPTETASTPSGRRSSPRWDPCLASKGNRRKIMK